VVKVLGVIHARGGSRRVPRKNVKNLLGAPLLAYMCRAAGRAELVDRLILSSDDDEIMAVGREYGVEVPFRRPAELAEDVPSEQVTLHALDWAEEDDGNSYDIVVSFQPTTPFVETASIDACIRQVIDSSAASCITAFAASQPPEWQFELDNNSEAHPFVAPVEGETGVFQTLPKRYLPNGAAYATRASALRGQSRLIAHPLRLEIMDEMRSVDIDTPFDWLIAEAVGRAGGFGFDNTN
jgi:CMP-N,N'-diacetyllegionaminic acid synthase